LPEEADVVIPATLVIGGNAAEREAAIAAALDTRLVNAAILEGLPSGSAPLDLFSTELPVLVSRIAPGCVCCTGNLTMRVTLNRMLRKSPARLYIGLASTAHVERIRAFLTQTPYDQLLCLTKDLEAGNR